MLLDWLQWNVVKILRWYFPTYMESIQKIAIFRDYEKASILIFPSFIRTNAIYFWTWILWYLSRKFLKYWRVYCSQRLEGPGEALPCPNWLFHIQVTPLDKNGKDKDCWKPLCLGFTTPSPCLPASHSPFLSQPGFSTWPIGQLLLSCHHGIACHDVTWWKKSWLLVHHCAYSNSKLVANVSQSILLYQAICGKPHRLRTHQRYPWGIAFMQRIKLDVHFLE